MLGNLGQLMHVVKNANRIRQSMREMNERMAAARIAGQAGDDQVQATVNGLGDIVSIRIEPALVHCGDIALLEGLTCAAIRDALTHSREAARKEMAEMTDELGLPDLGNMLGGGQP